jgi:gamma-resorcylate decarboxylase
VHAPRLMGSGLFDTYSSLQVILGHMGEGLPYLMWRIDNCTAWLRARKKYPAKEPIAHYFGNNFHLTTSGNFRTQTLINAMLEIGADRILFSTDWPFENVDDAAAWFDAASISETDRLKIGRTNAIRLFNLPLSLTADSPTKRQEMSCNRTSSTLAANWPMQVNIDRNSHASVSG